MTGRRVHLNQTRSIIGVLDVKQTQRMMGDVMDRAMIEDTVPAQEIEGTGGAIGVGLGIAGTAIGIATGETEREALAATDTMISEVCYVVRFST